MERSLVWGAFSTGAEPFFQIGFQDSSIVVVQIMRAEQKCHIAVLRGFEQRLPIGRFRGEFGAITLLEFLPFGGVAMEPMPQGIARRHVPWPAIELERFFLHSARPKAVHQEALAVALCCRFICSLDSNHVLSSKRVR